MRKRRWSIVLGAVLCLGITLASQVRACPACKFSVPTESDQGDEQPAAGTLAASAGRGYNLSVLFMMATPFMLAGSFAGALYLTMRKNGAHRPPEIE